ncbi:hypothetical protein [Bradyrhizobium sp. USDA 10063]
MKVKPGPLLLQASYWGGESLRTFNAPGKFLDVDYPLPEVLTRGKKSVKVRFVPHDHSSAGPVFGLRLFTVKAPDDK